VRGKSFLWWKSVAAAYVLRVNPAIHPAAAEIRRWQRPASWPQDPAVKVATMHVRHGDKATENPLIPFEHYILELRKYFPDVKHVQVITNDADVEEKYAAFPDITFLELDRLDSDIAIYRDFYVLAMGDVLVGTYTSNFGQMALHLSLMRTGFCSSLLFLHSYFHTDANTFHHLVFNTRRKEIDVEIGGKWETPNGWNGEVPSFHPFAAECRRESVTGKPEWELLTDFPNQQVDWPLPDS
jgi:hypothetical protein